MRCVGPHAADRIDRAAEWPGYDSNRSLPRSLWPGARRLRNMASLDYRERMGSAKDALVVPGDALENQPVCARPTFKEARK